MSTDTQQDAREQARHKASVMIAFAEGKWVREKHRAFPTSGWKNYDPSEEAPLWNWELFEYEVKPEERKPREIWVISNEDGSKDAYESEQVVTRTGEPYPNQVHYREVLPSENTGENTPS